MSIVRVGATKQYSDNWENIFSGGRKPAAAKTSSKANGKSVKKSPKKSEKASKKKSVGQKRKGK